MYGENKELLKSTFKYQIPSVLELKGMLRKLTHTSQIDQILGEQASTATEIHGQVTYSYGHNIMMHKHTNITLD